MFAAGRPRARGGQLTLLSPVREPSSEHWEHRTAVTTARTGGHGDRPLGGYGVVRTTAERVSFGSAALLRPRRLPPDDARERDAARRLVGGPLDCRVGA